MDLLVVEHEPLVRQTVVEILQDAGFDVFDADCAEAALDIAAVHGPPAVLITDLSPQRGSGFNSITLDTVMRQRHPQVCVLYTVGDSDCLIGRRLGARERCLAKPFSSTKLMRAVCDLMPNREFTAEPEMA